MDDNDQAVIIKKAEDLTLALRAIGLYEDRMEAVDQERPVFVVDLWVGDLAFSKRIQQPEQFDIDAEFRKMMNPVAEDQNKDAIQGLLEMLE